MSEELKPLWTDKFSFEEIITKKNKEDSIYNLHEDILCLKEDRDALRAELEQYKRNEDFNPPVTCSDNCSLLRKKDAENAELRERVKELKKQLTYRGVVKKDIECKLFGVIKPSRGYYISMDSRGISYLHHDGIVRNGVLSNDGRLAFWSTRNEAQAFLNKWEEAQNDQKDEHSQKSR